jgi:hypothetical protein
MYLGYVGFDSGSVRSTLEYAAKVTKEYQLYAKGMVAVDEELHKLFCTNTRLTFNSAAKLVKKYKLTKSKNKNWYEVYYPNTNSSESTLRKVKLTSDNNLFSE